MWFNKTMFKITMLYKPVHETFVFTSPADHIRDAFNLAYDKAQEVWGDEIDWDNLSVKVLQA